MHSLHARSVSRGGAGAIRGSRWRQQRQQRVGLVVVAAASAADSGGAPPPPTAAAASRRSTLLAASSLLLLSSCSSSAAAADKDPMGRYVKRKRLDPLASYVPALLLAREQLEASGGAFAEGDAAAARALLRSGAFRGVRESVRAVGEYATEAGQPGADLAAAFFRELEAVDLRMRAVELEQRRRDGGEEQKGVGGGSGGSGGSADDDDGEGRKGAVDASVAALDALVATVPSDTVERAREVVASVAAGGGAAAAGGRAGAGRGAGGGADRALIEGLLATEQQP